MSGLYVYGITARAERIGVKGIFGRRLRTIAVGRLRAIVESAPRPPRATLSALTAHHRVVAALVRNGITLLPVRFGSFVADGDRLARTIGDRDVALRRVLRKVHGCVQMTTRVRVGTAAGERHRSSRSGTSHLRALAARETARRSHPLVRTIERAARRYARASQVEWQGTRSEYIVVHHLIPRDRVDDYRTAVVRTLSSGGAAASMSGPWAPFAFVEIA